MKKFLSLFLAILLAVFSLTSCIKMPNTENSENDLVSEDEQAEQNNQEEQENSESFRKEGIYPVKWDITNIYDSVDEWEADYEKIVEMMPQISQYKGTLHTAEGIYNYQNFMTGDYYDLCMRVTLYAELLYYIDPSDPVALDCISKLGNLGQMESQYTKYFFDEIFELSLKERKKLLEDPLLEDYAYALRYIIDPRTEVLNDKENEILTELSSAIGNEKGIYETFDYMELPYIEITMPDGTVAELTPELENDIVNGDYDRDFKIETYITSFTRREPFINTYANILDGHIRSAWANTQVQDFDSTLEYTMYVSDVDYKVFDMIIEAANKGIPEYQRYLDAHRKALGNDDLYYFEQKINSSDYTPGKVTYDEAVEDVLSSLSVLGKDYTDTLKDILKNGNVDVFPEEGKYTGEFSLYYGNEFLPYLLLNYDGYAKSISGIAHELGHAAYSLWSAKNQSPANAVPTTYTQEVASITNEFLRYINKIESAKSDDEKLYYIENLLYAFCGSFFVQCEYEEFEDYCYYIVENGGKLDANTLCQAYYDILYKYRGDAMETFEENAYGWAEIPHFYSSYYVFNYATSACYAAAICERIMSGEKDAVENYKEMLTLGNSMSPTELLAVAGIDPLDQASYDYALEFFGKYVDLYEELINAKTDN